MAEPVRKSGVRVAIDVRRCGDCLLDIVQVRRHVRLERQNVRVPLAACQHDRPSLVIEGVNEPVVGKLPFWRPSHDLAWSS